MAIVVADAGPLRYLVQIGQINLLPRLFQRVFIPPVIVQELTRSATPEVVRAWMNSMPDWIEVQEVACLEDPPLKVLDAGERAAIALGLSMKADLLLIDDRRAVVLASVGRSGVASQLRRCFLLRPIPHNADPNGFIPCFSTVFGYSPVPQMMNEPKSLYQPPSGAHGSVMTQLRSLCRSSRVIARSATRFRMCSHNGRGRLANRIFGNRRSPEDRPDQIFADFDLLRRVPFGHEVLVGSRESAACCGLRFDASLGKRYQRPTHGHVAFLCHAPHFTHELRRDRHTLSYGRSLPTDCGFPSSLHVCIVHSVHHCGALLLILAVHAPVLGV